MAPRVLQVPAVDGPDREHCGPGCDCLACQNERAAAASQRRDDAPELFEALAQLEAMLCASGLQLVLGVSSRSGYVFAGAAQPGQPVRIACHGDCLADCFVELAAIFQAAPTLLQSNPALGPNWVPHT